MISVREFNNMPKGVDVARLEEYIDLYITKTAQYGKRPPLSPIDVHLVGEFKGMTQDNLDKITEIYLKGGWILKLEDVRSVLNPGGYKIVLTPLDPPAPASQMVNR